MCGGTTVNSPAPDPVQLQLEQSQLQDLQQSRQDINDFKPFVLQQYGLQDNYSSLDTGSHQKISAIDAAKADITNGATPAQLQAKYGQSLGLNAGTPLDSTGIYLDNLRNSTLSSAGVDPTISRYSKTADQIAKDKQLADLQAQTLTIQKAQQQRIQDALAGKIGPSAALLDRQQNDFNVLKQDQGNNGNEIIGDNLDNATAKTTSGIQALEGLRKTYGVLKDSENNAIIQGEASLPGVYQSQYAGSNTLQNPGAPGASQGVAGLSPLYASAYQPYQFQQQMQFGADSMNATNRTNMLTGLISAGIKGAATAAAA